MKPLFRVTGTVAVTVLLAQAALAQDASLVTARPDPKGVPTPVSVGIFFVDIMEIDDVAQTFKADVIATIAWRDPRLALPDNAENRSDRVFALVDIWDPELTLINRRDVRILSANVARVSANGGVRVELRRFAEFASRLDLRQFPFDTQTLWLDVASTRYGPEEIALSLDRAATGGVPEFSITGWRVEIGKASISHIRFHQGKDVVRIVQELTASRVSTFFIMKVIVPLSFIVFMAWTVFWVDPEHIGPQLGISTASVLTLIAFQFSLVNMLPRVAYLTEIDIFLLGATVLVFLALGEAIWSSRLAKAGEHDKAKRIDGISRWVYGILFSVLLVIVFV